MTDDRSDRPVSGEVVSGSDARRAGEGTPVPGPTGARWSYETRSWSYEARPNVPVLGIFLVGLGAILLLDAIAPGSVGLLVAGAGVALGAAFLYSRARGGWGLYPGLILVALSLPNLLVGLGVVPDRGGYSTFLLGAGLLVVAAVRLRDRRGVGWQAWLGAVLTAFGAVEIAGYAATGDAIWALALIAVGGWVLLSRR